MFQTESINTKSIVVSDDEREYSTGAAKAIDRPNGDRSRKSIDDLQKEKQMQLSRKKIKLSAEQDDVKTSLRVTENATSNDDEADNEIDDCPSVVTTVESPDKSQEDQISVRSTSLNASTNDSFSSRLNVKLSGIYYDDIELTQCANHPSFFTEPIRTMHYLSCKRRNYDTQKCVQPLKPHPLCLKNIPFGRTEGLISLKEKPNCLPLTHIVHKPQTKQMGHDNRNLCLYGSANTGYEVTQTRSSLFDAAVVLSTQLPRSGLSSQ